MKKSLQELNADSQEVRAATDLLSGKTICSVTENLEKDEGLVLHLSDGSALAIGYSSNEGSIIYHYPAKIKLA